MIDREWDPVPCRGRRRYTVSPHPLADLIPPLARPIRLLLAAGLLTLGASQALPAWAAPDCRQGAEVRIWTSPLRPQPGEPLEVLAVATDGDLDQIQVTDPGGRPSPLRPVRYGGPPWSLHGGLFRPVRGTYRIEALRGGRVAACTEIAVGGGTGERGSGEWDLATEALYSAWIERLFDAPLSSP